MFFLAVKTLHAMNFPTEEKNSLPSSAMNLSKEPSEEILVTEAKKANSKTQFDLAFLYEKQGKIEDAIVWYTKAAEQGFVDAQFNLGIFYSQQRKKDNAISWYKKAAEQGLAKAQYYLTLLYQKKKNIKEVFIGE